MHDEDLPSFLRGRELLTLVKSDFPGLRVRYELATGQSRRRVFLDSAASSLPMGVVLRAARRFVPHYSNTHSFVHFAARISTSAYAWAHRRVLSFLGADDERYACVFVGSGSTAGFNRVSRMFRRLRPDRDTVLVSLMEHHSNDLPHRRYHPRIVIVPCEGESKSLGPIDLGEVRRLLGANARRTNYVAVTAASNVTGTINPVAEIARMAHEHDSHVVVDGSQIVAHHPVAITSNADPSTEPDVFVFSGHKVYAPGSPGVIVVRKELLRRIEPIEMGGGMVEKVWRTGYRVTDELPDREEAGTPNILGAVQLATAIEILDRIGMDVIRDEEDHLARRLVEGLLSIPEVVVYGCTDLSRVRRTPCVVFNLVGVHHALLAAILNDYFNIAVRNECFCAQPYVREMLLEELWETDVGDDDMIKVLQHSNYGMVRVSVGIYNTEEDIYFLLDALRAILVNRSHFLQAYRLTEAGDYVHNTFAPRTESLFDPQAALDMCLVQAWKGRLRAPRT